MGTKYWFFTARHVHAMHAQAVHARAVHGYVMQGPCHASYIMQATSCTPRERISDEKPCLLPLWRVHEIKRMYFDPRTHGLFIT
jgi:hypothetical protein